MADEKLNTGPADNTSPEAAGPITTPEQAAASEPQQEQTGPAIPESGDVVVSFDKINELMAEKRQNARAEVEKAEPPETPEAAAPGETPQPANTEEPKKPRRGRPPKAEKAATENQKSEKSAWARKGRPPKADKTAPDKPKPSKRDKVSRSDGKAPDAKEPVKPTQDTSPKETATAEQTAPEPTTPPRPIEEGKLVYLKLSEVHPFHTFRPHPFKVRDDAKMQEIVASIRVNGVMVPGLARPEKDGNGYEIVAGHRRTHGSELAGLEEMPFIVREMTDHEAVQAMKDSNKQRDGMLPSELAALLELEVEDIKHQGGRLKGVAEGDVGKRSVEIVGEAHEMNYKKVMRYLRLNSLVPELLDKVDDKKMGFMQSCSSTMLMLGNAGAGALGASTYPCEDRDMLAAEAAYCALEDDLQHYLDTYESTHDYDEYHFDLDEIEHDPYVLLSLLCALHEGQWTIGEVQGTLQMLFDRQYILTEDVVVETRYRTETDTWTDEDGNSHTDTYQVPYDYYICTVTLENFDLSHVPVYVMGEEQLSRYAIYMATLGNRPDLFPDSPYVNKYITGKPGDYEVPGEYLDDETFAAMLAEAQKYIGYPYVWGGSSPATSFDCSGYVSWVINHSGWNVGRLGAQGLYNICTPTSSPNPGDLVFFKGTYDTPGVSHCGIYVGDGKMLHCGDPIGYANLNTSYWQSHFYAYGRLP